jgi:hypothetical protein
LDADHPEKGVLIPRRLTGKLILGEAGSSSTRMSDVFKSQPHWRRLIDSDGRGRYRLRVPQR